jgi:hypothetical protein
VLRKLKQATGSHFKINTGDEALKQFIAWASCHAIITAIVKQNTPVSDLESLSAETLKVHFREKLEEFAIKQDFAPVPSVAQGQLAGLDGRIRIIWRASDGKECLAPAELIDSSNVDHKFEEQGWPFSRKTVWLDKKDVPRVER